MVRKGEQLSETTKLKISNTLKGHGFSDESKRKISASLTGKKLSEETKKKQSLAHLGNRYCLGHHPSKETRRKMSESHKRHPNPAKSPEARAKISASKKGPLNAAWKGGTSFRPYCQAFNKKLKEEIREQFDRKCGYCDSIENGRKHSVHHIDYNKMQGCGKHRRWNLVPLCTKCHPLTNFNRWYWFALFYNRWAMKDEFASMAGM